LQWADLSITSINALVSGTISGTDSCSLQTIVYANTDSREIAIVAQSLVSANTIARYLTQSIANAPNATGLCALQISEVS
jgi:hypothetical protein